MSTQPQKDINITINTDKSNDLDHSEFGETYKEYKEYIITNNIFLQKQRLVDLKQIKDLESQVTLKEEEEDKNDNRIRYMKGLIQNLLEIKNFYIKLNYKYKNLSDIYNLIYNEITIINYKFLLYSSLLNICIYLLNFDNNIINKYINLFIYNSLIFAIIVYLINKLSLVYKKNQNINNEITNNKIKNIVQEIKDQKSEIKKLEDSTISLDNWICEI